MKKSILIFLVLVLANSVFAQVPHIEADYDYPAPLMEMPRPSEREISVYYQNGKAGVRYKDSNITEPIYDKAYFNRSNGIIVKKEKKYGFYNKHAELIIPLRYDSISAVDSYTLKIKSNNKYGLVNIEGDKLLNIRHNDILGVSKSGMYVVKNKKGIIEILGNKGKKIISNLSSVRLYKNGAVVGNGKKYALVTKNHQSGFIYDSIPVNSYNKNYKLRRGYTRNYRDVISMGQGLHRIVVLKEGKVGMIDTLNQVIIPIEQDEIIYQRRRDYYLVKKGKMFGYYLKKCDKYGSPFYDQIYMDGTVFLKVNKKGKWGIIDDATGEMILPTIYESVYMTNGTFILKKDRKKGVSDFKGKIIIPIIYDKIDNLANFFSSEFKGFYKVTIGKQSGIITSNNKTVIPIKFEYIGEFEDNFFLAVDTNRNFGLFSKSGEVVQKLKYDFIERKRKDKATVFFTYKNDLIGVLDQQGKEIFSPQFKKASIVPDESHDIVRVERYENAYFLAMTDTNNNTGLFDLYTGKFIIPRKYEKIYQQTNKHFYLAKLNGKFGMLNAKNEVIIDFIYDTLSLNNTYVDDYKKMDSIGFVAKKKGRFGVINFHEKILIPFKYRELAKLNYNGLYKAKKKGHFVLINEQNQVLNKGPFDDIANFEQFPREDGWSFYSKAMSFYKGEMREIDENGKFLTEPIEMNPHNGFTSLEELKNELRIALESKNDSLLYHFAKKIAPSPHLVYLIDESQERLYERSQNLSYTSIYARYYETLLKFKYYYWNSKYYDKSNLETEDYTVSKRGIVTNSRRKDWAYGDTKYLEKILRHSIKINGYWISSYYGSRYF